MKKTLLVFIMAALAAVNIAWVAYPGIVWDKSYDSGQLDDVTGMVADQAGNIYVAGYSTNVEGYSDFLLVKYDSDGNRIWEKPYGSGVDEKAYSVDVDDAGNVYVAGIYMDGGIQDFLIVKYDPDGNVLWDTTYDRATDRAYGIAVDGSGNVYVTGYLIESGGDFMTVKYNITGAVAWERIVDESADDKANDIAVNASGNPCVVGVSRNGQQFDLTMVKYSSAGAESWRKVYDFGRNEFAHAVAFDDADNIYVVGYSMVDPDDRWLTGKFTSSGDSVWVLTHNTGSNDAAHAVTVDANGNVFAAGQASGAFYIVKYDEIGDILWESSDFSGCAYGICVDTSGYIYVAGTSASGSDTDFRIVKYEELESIEENGSRQASVRLEVVDNLSSIPTIRYSIPEGQHGTLTFYSADGRNLESYSLHSAQTSFSWISDNPSGVYFAKFSIGNSSITAKIVLTR